jgi:hypothetical protein
MKRIRSLFFSGATAHYIADKGVAVTSRMPDRFRRQERMQPDNDLVERSLRGDAAAWDQLVDRYGALVWTIAWHYQPSQAEAETVFLRVFDILLKSLPRVRRELSLAAWLAQVTEQQAQRQGTGGSDRVGQD